MLTDVRTQADEAVHVLYASEFHHLLDDRHAYVFCEAILYSRQDTPAFTFTLHQLHDSDVAECLTALENRPEFEELRSQFDDAPERLYSPDTNSAVHLYQGTFRIRTGDPYPFNRTFGLARVYSTHLNSFSWWGTLVEAPLCLLGHINGTPTLDLSPSTGPGQAANGWRKNTVYGVRFGVFAERYPDARRSVVARVEQRYGLEPYSVHYFNSHLGTPQSEDSRTPSRLWLRCHPTKGIAPIVEALENRRENDPSLSLELRKPHSTLWFITHTERKVRNRFRSATRIVYRGRLQWLLFGEHRPNIDLELFRVRPGDIGPIFASIPTHLSTELYVQKREVHVMRRIRRVAAACGVGAFLASLLSIWWLAWIWWLAPLGAVAVYMAMSGLEQYFTAREALGYTRVS